MAQLLLELDTTTGDVSARSIAAAGTEVAYLDVAQTFTENQTIADDDLLGFGSSAISTIYSDGTDTFFNLRNSGSGAIMVAMETGYPSPDSGNFHFWKGDATDATASTNRGLVLEHSTNAAFEILIPTAKSAQFRSTSEIAGDVGSLLYNHSGATPASTWRIYTLNTPRIHIAANEFEFQEATNISTTSGNLTLDPGTDSALTLELTDGMTAAALSVAVSSQNYYTISTRHAVTAGPVHTFAAADRGSAAAVANTTRMIDVKGFTQTYTGTTDVTNTTGSFNLNLDSLTLSGESGLTAAVASGIRLNMPTITTMTTTDVAGIRIIEPTSSGVITTLTGIKFMQLLSEGATNIGIDMESNSIENVGASGNDWTTEKLQHNNQTATATNAVAFRASDGGGGFSWSPFTSMSAGQTYFIQDWEIVTLTGSDPTTYTHAYAHHFQGIRYIADEDNQTITKAYTMYLEPPTVSTAGSGAAPAITTAATLYISAAASGGTITNNYALWVDAGVSRFEGNVHVYQGASGATARGEARLIIEDDVTAELNFMTPNDVTAGITFGSPDSAFEAYIHYQHANNRYSIAVEATEQARWTDGGFEFLKATELNMFGAGSSLTNVGAAGNDWTANLLAIDSENSGANNRMNIYNRTEDDAASSVMIDLRTFTSGGGDAIYLAAINGVVTWGFGADNANSGKFVLGPNSSLGQSDILRLDGRTTGQTSVARYQIANLSSTLDQSATIESIMFDMENCDTVITGATTVTRHQALGMRMQTQRMSSDSTVTVNDVSHYYITGVPSPDANVTFTDSNGIYITNIASHGGTVTNQTAIKLEAQTGGGTTNVGIDMGTNSLMAVGNAASDWDGTSLRNARDYFEANDYGMVIGHDAFVADMGGSSITPEFQVLGTHDSDSAITIGNFSTGTRPRLIFVRSKNTAIGGKTIVATDDSLGMIMFAGDDGVDYHMSGVRIEAFADTGTQSTSSMPGRLTFSTTADGENAVTEHMRISADGTVTLRYDKVNVPITLHLKNLETKVDNSGTGPGIYFTGWSGTAEQSMCYIFGEWATESSASDTTKLTFSTRDTVADVSPRMEIHGNGDMTLLGNDLINVGTTGNDFTTAGISYVGTGKLEYTRAQAAQAVLQVAHFVADSLTVDPDDDFGVQIGFSFKDDTDTTREMGYLQYKRDGDDLESEFSIFVRNGSGASNQGLILTKTGVLSVDLGGSGTAAQVDLFDDYDDPMELQRYTHMQSDRFGTIDEREASFDKMLDMGIISEAPNASSGYHMNLQPMVRLLAGGIYQNRERMDAQHQAMDARLKRIEQALGV